MFFRAAINAYIEERYSDSGVFACLAVLYDEVDAVKNMIYSIIFNSCVKSNDASAAVKLLKKFDISELNMELLQALYLA